MLGGERLPLRLGQRQLDFLGGESWFLLARNWALVGSAASWLEAAGIPYSIRGDAQIYSPWSDKGPLKAAKTVLSLSRGERVRASELGALILGAALAACAIAVLLRNRG